MRSNTLTDRQGAVLDYILEHLTLRCPTYRQIMAGMDFASPNAVKVHIDALERKGFVKRDEHAERSVILSDAATVAGNIKVGGETFRLVKVKP